MAHVCLTMAPAVVSQEQDATQGRAGRKRPKEWEYGGLPDHCRCVFCLERQKEEQDKEADKENS